MLTWCATIGFVVMFTCRSRLKLLAVCFSLFASGVVVPCVLVLYVRQSDVTAGGGRAPDSTGRRDGGGRLTERRDAASYREDIEELKRQVAELEKIKMSARNELLELGEKLSQTKVTHSAPSKDSRHLTSRGGGTGGEENEKKTQHASKMAPLNCPPPPSVAQPPPIVILSPLHTAAVVEADAIGGAISDRCSFPVCFDYARCPLTRPFSVYVYGGAGDPIPGRSFPLDHVTKRALIDILNSTSSLAPRPQDACLFVVPLDMGVWGAGGLEGLLESLPHWGREGTNHVLLALHSGPHHAPQVGRAITVGNVLRATPTSRFRSGYDVLLPILPGSHGDPKLTTLPSMLPEMRSFLLYFSGNLLPFSFRATPTSPRGLELAALETLRDALRGVELVAIDTACQEGGVAEGMATEEGEWALCGNSVTRLDGHAHSTFSLILPGRRGGVATYTRLLESLQAGSVPVVVGVAVLPLDDVIDWSRIALLVPLGRLAEIHYILRGVASVTVTQYRLQGRVVWNAYFSSLRGGVSAVIALLRQRTGHPPPLAPDYVGRTLVSTGMMPESGTSPVFVQNWTVYAGDIWNRPPGPFYSYPLTPYKPLPLSGVQYEGVASSALLLLPPHIVQAGGTTGEEFEVCVVCVCMCICGGVCVCVCLCVYECMCAY